MTNTANIVGNLIDAGVTALGGVLTVTATASFVDDSTTPDTIITRVPYSYTVTAGVIDIDVPVSAPAKVAYTFVYTPSGATEPVLKFDAVVPDQATVEFGSLLGTSFTTDRIATDAIRIARELLTNPTLVPLVISALKITLAAVQPTVGATDEIWVDTVEGRLATSDGARWLLSPTTSTAITADAESTDMPILLEMPIPITQNAVATVNVVRCVVDFNVQAAPHDGANHYSIKPGYRSTASLTPAWLAAAVDTDALSVTPGTNTRYTFVIDVDLNTVSTSFLLFQITATGSPGDLTLTATYVLREEV